MWWVQHITNHWYLGTWNKENSGVRGTVGVQHKNVDSFDCRR